VGLKNRRQNETPSVLCRAAEHLSVSAQRRMTGARAGESEAGDRDAALMSRAPDAQHHRSRREREYL